MIVFVKNLVPTSFKMKRKKRMKPVPIIEIRDCHDQIWFGFNLNLSNL